MISCKNMSHHTVHGYTNIALQSGISSIYVVPRTAFFTGSELGFGLGLNVRIRGLSGTVAVLLRVIVVSKVTLILSGLTNRMPID